MIPLVSVIGLAYNHAHFLAESLDSVVAQTYANIELIIVDDASPDGSADVIQAWVAKHPAAAARLRVQVLLLQQNVGNCTAFNQGLARSQGEFVVDLALDDVLLPSRLAEQVAAFAKLDASWGVVYTDCELMAEDGTFVRRFYSRDAANRPVPAAPSGEVFSDVLGRYFISTPTMLMRRAVLDELGGYDETLAYEDFDFWVRSARHYRYFYLDRPLTRKRLHPASLSRQVYRPGDRQLDSTIRICTKAAALCRTPAEWDALAHRLRSELRQAARHRLWGEAERLYALLQQVSPAPGGLYRLLGAWAKLWG